MAEAGAVQEDDLAEACSRAPKFGLNAKALILQAALAEDDEPPAKRPDPAAEAAAATARRGGEYLAAVDVKQRPLVAYLARSKIPRINRQTVLNKLAGEHLALAAAAQSPSLEPAAAAADLELRKAAFAAALAQELELFGRCGSAQVYQNLAARTSATQWAQPGGIDASQQAQRAQQQAQQAQPADQWGGTQPPATSEQQEQPSTDGSGGAEQDARPSKRARPSAAAAGRPAARAALEQPRLQECDLDWEAAPATEAEGNGAKPAVGSGDAVAVTAAAAAQHIPAAAAAQQGAAGAAAQAPHSAQTELGSLQLQPLAQLPAADRQPAPSPAAEAAARPDASGATATPRGPAPDLPPATAAAPAAGTASAAAVRQQVELFVRAELHPLLKRQQISAALHDAVCERCTAKVMACHADATSADFLVPEAASIRALVKRYLEHMRRQG